MASAQKLGSQIVHLIPLLEKLVKNCHRTIVLHHQTVCTKSKGISFFSSDVTLKHVFSNGTTNMKANMFLGMQNNSNSSS